MKSIAKFIAMFIGSRSWCLPNDSKAMFIGVDVEHMRQCLSGADIYGCCLWVLKQRVARANV